MAQIGELLTRIRNKKDLSLGDVEKATKIRVKYLQALENEEYDQIPGQVYVIGFLRTYSRYLGLEDEVIVNEYRQQTENWDQCQQLVEEPLTVNKWHRKGMLTTVVLLGVAVLFVLGVIGSKFLPTTPVITDDPLPTVENNDPNQQPLEETGKEPDVNTPPAASDTPVQTGDEKYADEPEPLQGIAAEVEIDTGRCWIEVVSDGEIIYSGTLTGPVIEQYQAEKVLAITFGNAGVVRLTVNGEFQGTLGRQGDVVNKEYRLENLTKQ